MLVASNSSVTIINGSLRFPCQTPHYLGPSAQPISRGVQAPSNSFSGLESLWWDVLPRVSQGAGGKMGVLVSGWKTRTVLGLLLLYCDFLSALFYSSLCWLNFKYQMAKNHSSSHQKPGASKDKGNVQHLVGLNLNDILVYMIHVLAQVASGCGWFETLLDLFSPLNVLFSRGNVEIKLYKTSEHCRNVLRQHCQERFSSLWEF